MKEKVSAKNFPPTAERRRFARQKVNSLIYLNVKPDNGGILLDLSEGGMCISVANPLAVSSEVQFSLGFVGSEPVEGTGVVSWLSSSGRSAGVRFVRFPKGSRERVHEWLEGSNAPVEQGEAPPTPARPQRHEVPKKDSEDSPRVTAEKTGAAQKVPEPPATAENPLRTPTKEFRAPSTYTIFAHQPRPPAMLEESEPEPETPHLNLKMPSFFMPQQQEKENDSPPEAEDPTETYFGDGIGGSGSGGGQHVAAYRLAVTSGSELSRQEEKEKEGLQIKKFLVVAAVCGSLLALGVLALLIYTGTIPVTQFFSAIAAPQTVSMPLKSYAPRRARSSPRRPEISTRGVRGGRPARDVNTFYAPGSDGGSFPVEVTDRSHERWLATVTSQNLARGGSPDAIAKGLPSITGGTGSASPAGETRGMRADGALVEEGAVASSFANGTEGRSAPKEIVVEAVIGTDGDVKSVRLVSSPASQLAQAVVEAVRQWHYRPFYRDGQPVQFTTKITFNFSRVDQKP